ncbi:DUF5133 domain-containing protein [Streptomyces sp. GC420]|uniref:DUF5133 domain-containing protein n=1 Tax=Streptomyces sp. GC420 TaxID=2697568 RepID=UPI0014152F87|nr:DUF5133 domain-containing protein [Streptomyces sp. GC420]NBM20589.1 DUF5133 domain-containing protein [Streptomyces sp. GC420]
MLLASPLVLRDLIEEYETSHLTGAPRRSGQQERRERQRTEDLVHALCVSTGTYDIDAALRAARALLEGAEAADCEPAGRDPSRSRRPRGTRFPPPRRRFAAREVCGVRH